MIDKVFKYSKKLRNLDEGVLKLFKDIVVIGDEGELHEVPAIWATEEKATTNLFQENLGCEIDFKGTLQPSKLVLDRIKLPMISVCRSDIAMVGSEPHVKYKAVAYSFFREDMNQILEQVLLKFDNKKNCKLHSISNNEDNKEVMQLRVVKSLFDLVVEGIDGPVETHE